MEKVKVSQKQYEMIKNHENDFEQFLFKMCEIKENTSFKDMELAEAVMAFFHHEIELTTEEKILQLFNALPSNDHYDFGRRNGMKEILELLKIKVEGIND